MAALMAASDLYIGAGGTTTWERCSLGLPGICIATAENQVEIAKALHQAGVHRFLGRANEITDELIVNEVNQVLAAPHILRQYSEKSIALTVGKRLEEIALFIENEAI
jgi:spore coat polysaccharide biosynthesis predicted glycosyltransferase SpsG